MSRKSCWALWDWGEDQCCTAHKFALLSVAEVRCIVGHLAVSQAASDARSVKWVERVHVWGVLDWQQNLCINR